VQMVLSKEDAGIHFEIVDFLCRLLRHLRATLASQPFLLLLTLRLHRAVHRKHLGSAKFSARLGQAKSQALSLFEDLIAPHFTDELLWSKEVVEKVVELKNGL